jgi:hypothetical protein
MFHFRCGAYALGLVAIATLTPNPAAAAGNTPTRTVVPYVTEPIYNPCTQETVFITGEAVLFSSTKLTKNGTLEATFRIKVNAEGTAISATGETVAYVLRSDETTKLGDFANGGLEAVVLAKSLLVRKGADGQEFPTDSDWLVKQTMRIKLDSLGNAVVDRTFASDSCAN